MMTTWQITGPANVLLLLRKDGCICIRDINFIESNNCIYTKIARKLDPVQSTDKTLIVVACEDL